MVSLLILQWFRLCVLHGTADSFYSNDPQLQAEQLSGRYCLFSPPPPTLLMHRHILIRCLNIWTTEEEPSPHSSMCSKVQKKKKEPLSIVSLPITPAAARARSTCLRVYSCPLQMPVMAEVHQTPKWTLGLTLIRSMLSESRQSVQQRKHIPFTTKKRQEAHQWWTLLYCVPSFFTVVIFSFTFVVLGATGWSCWTFQLSATFCSTYCQQVVWPL